MSLTQQLRSEAALSTTFGKGQALARDGGVLAVSADPSAINGTVRLEGTVLGSGGSIYTAHVTLDLAEDDVVDYGCSCPASYKYGGMCKHEIALALVFAKSAEGSRMRADAQRGRAGEETRPVLAGGPQPAPAGRFGSQPAPAGGPGSQPAPAGRPGSKAVPTAAARAVRAIPTDPRIQSLVSSAVERSLDEAAAQRRARSLRRSAPAEPAELLVSLAPAADSLYLSPGETTWCLKLRVRQGKAAYIVKSMRDLVRAWRTRAEVVYGKNLTLVHDPAAFTERSRAVMGVVERVVDSQQALFASRWKYWDAGRGTQVKELPVSEADIVDLLDALQGSTVTVDPNTGSLRTRLPERSLEVVRGNPDVRASLRPAADGGYDLSLPAGDLAFSDGGRLYVLDERRAWGCEPDFARTAGPLFEALLPAERPLHVGAQDLAGFCRQVLPALRASTLLEAPDSLEAFVPPEPEFTFRVSLEDGRVFCRASVAYNDWSASIYEARRPGQPPRDLAAEYRAQDVVEEYFPGDGADPSFDESDDELLYTLLTEGLSALSELGEVLLSERLRSIEVRESPQVRVRATVRSGLLDLAVDASGLSPRDLAAYLDSYKRKQKFMRLSSGDIVKLDGSVRALNDLAEGLGVDAAELASGTLEVPSNRSLFVDAMLKKAENVRLDGSASFRAVVRDFDTFSDADFEVPESLADVLRPYQVDGFRWLETLERLGFGGILADDMGLGKTLQVIAHILARKEAGDGGATLVVCPASLVYNWMAELARFAPQLDAAAVVGGKAARREAIAGAAGRDVLVTSYDLMKRDVEEYARVRFRRVVLDEAHYIKNAGTQAAKAARCLAADARFALTGTPIENRLSELWSVFDFLMPGILGSHESFNKRFAGPVEHGEEGAARRLSCMVAPFILRRLKADVLADLPDKSESVVYARMEGEQDKLYKASQDRLAMQVQHELPDEFKKSKLQVLAELTKLREICCDPRLLYDNYTAGSAKLDTCMELVANALDAGHRILLFSQFTSMLELISERLRAEKVQHLVLTGSTSKEERARLVERFQAGAAPVFLISLKAGGVGLNLTAADVVIHYDPWWNLAAQNQATDRAHRIGQTRDVSVFKLICQGTIEERIVEMQERKRDLAESVLGGEGAASAKLTRDDVLALLGAQAGEA